MVAPNSPKMGRFQAYYDIPSTGLPAKAGKMLSVLMVGLAGHIFSARCVHQSIKFRLGLKSYHCQLQRLIKRASHLAVELFCECRNVTNGPKTSSKGENQIYIQQFCFSHVNHTLRHSAPKTARHKNNRPVCVP